MRKLLFALLICLPAACLAQKDFDYSFYTTKFQVLTTDTSKARDSVPELFLIRHIKKEGSLLHIISAGNTGNSALWELTYIGWDSGDSNYLYEAHRVTAGQGERIIHIKVEPTEARLKFFFDNRTEIYY